MQYKAILITSTRYINQRAISILFLMFLWLPLNHNFKHITPSNNSLQFLFHKIAGQVNINIFLRGKKSKANQDINIFM